VAPVYNLQFNIKDTAEEITNVMQRVDRALFRDVFMAMTQLGNTYQPFPFLQKEGNCMGLLPHAPGFPFHGTPFVVLS
jgi:hypothetical protein